MPCKGIPTQSGGIWLYQDPVTRLKDARAPSCGSESAILVLIQQRGAAGHVGKLRASMASGMYTGVAQFGNSEIAHLKARKTELRISHIIFSVAVAQYISAVTFAVEI